MQLKKKDFIREKTLRQCFIGQLPDNTIKYSQAGWVITVIYWHGCPRRISKQFLWELTTSGLVNLVGALTNQLT
jgi:hypothetical protein